MQFRHVLAVAVPLLVANGASAQSVPAAIVPPAASRLLSIHLAKGVQIYTCSLKAGVAGWVLKAPDADLVDARGRPFAHHFAGPSWQAADGSRIVGTLLAKAPSHLAGAIPWLLLSAKSAGVAGVLAHVHFVQRIDTEGGIAPPGACAPGQELRVPYRAHYAFFE